MTAKSLLFTPLRMRQIVLNNRIGVAPMCQYSARDGLPNMWHTVHVGSRAVGRPGLFIAEAAAVAPQARISPADIGMWNEDQARAWQPLTAFIKEQGVVAGIQLAHAGRKGSTQVPWLGRSKVSLEAGGWSTQAPSALAFDPTYTLPAAMTLDDIQVAIAQFCQAARLSAMAGFEVLELHMGHGYLVHQFLSPLTNHRDDAYGGSLEGRFAFALELAAAVRRVWPDDLPLFVRLSVTDWQEGGWETEQSILLARRLRDCGVDLIDCSSGSIAPGARVRHTPGFQVPLAEAIRRDGGIPTAAVGMITDPAQAESILQQGGADVILLARELLRDPYWPLRARQSLEGHADWPVQYQRALAN